MAFARNRPETIVDARVADAGTCLRGADNPLRLRHEVGGATIHASGKAFEWLGTELLGDGFLRCIHIQDRPVFLKALSDAVNQDIPVFAQLRLHTIKGLLRAEASFWPEDEEVVKSAVSIMENEQQRDRRGLHALESMAQDHNHLRLLGLAQGELLDIASSFSLLCRFSPEGGEAGFPEMRTVRHLFERLEAVGSLLSTLDDEQFLATPGMHSSLIEVVQAAVSRQEKKACDRKLSLSVDVAGAVREPVGGLIAHLIEFFVVSAVQMVSFSGTIDITTRREGRAVVITAVLSSVHHAGDTGSEPDMAIIRNLSVHRGGQFSVGHQLAPSQRWILRLPLDIESNSVRKDTGSLVNTASRRRDSNVISTKQDKSVA